MTWHDTFFEWIYRILTFQVYDVYICRYLSFFAAFAVLWISRLAQILFLKVVAVLAGVCIYFLPELLGYWAVR